MIKVTFCLHRLPHLSREAFQKYWLENHGPLVTRNAETLGVRRYVQLHRLETETNERFRAIRGAPEPYDGVAELWFDSQEAMQRAFGAEAGRATGKALLEDERKFIDWSRSPIWIGEEKVLVGG